LGCVLSTAFSAKPGHTHSLPRHFLFSDWFPALEDFVLGQEPNPALIEAVFDDGFCFQSGHGLS
jgi:hypothetical protein